MNSAQRAHREHAAHRVLVVDDNPDAADSLAMLLQALGNDVHVAYDGEDAVDKALQFSPEIVLLDIGLPKMHGYDVARRIRDAQGRDVMLVAVTGWGQEDDRRRSREAGFDYHFTKPVDPEDLARLIGAAPPSTSH
jgi:CheY-like chemotaxis protein